MKKSALMVAQIRTAPTFGVGAAASAVFKF